MSPEPISPNEPPIFWKVQNLCNFWLETFLMELQPAAV